MFSLGKISQLKTGFMECQDSTQEVYYCNQCKPKPQRKTKTGLEIAINSTNVYRIARNEAILLDPDQIMAMSDYTLTTITMTNTVITWNKGSFNLETFLTSLAEKCVKDERWIECAACRYIVLDEASYKKATTFL